MADALGYEGFRDHIGEAFLVAAADDGGDCSLLLDEVRRMGPVPGAPRHEPFALLFSGPREPALAQATYRLRHGDLGELDIFLVPVGRAPGGGLLYEAIFN